MRLARPAFAPDPRDFGQRGLRDTVAEPVGRSVSEDFKLFALTFVAGFLFVSVLIG